MIAPYLNRLEQIRSYTANRKVPPKADIEWLEMTATELLEALNRFKLLAGAVENSYPAECIIRCEVTADDIRTALKAITKAEGRT